jgi:hypothetical protein
VKKARKTRKAAPFDSLARRVEREVALKPDEEYPILAMDWHSKGLYTKYTKKESEIKERY